MGCSDDGLPVFPLVAHGKEPRFKGSFHNATTDQTRRFRWKRLNTGAHQGHPMGRHADSISAIDESEGCRASASIRDELEVTVAGMSPAARAVYEGIQTRVVDAEPKFLHDFGALTAIERSSVTKAVELLKGLAEAEAAENAEDQAHSKGVSRRHRQLWLGSVLISIACVLAVISISISVYTAPTKPDPADTVMTDPGAVRDYLGAHVPASAQGAEPPVFIPTGLYIESVEFSGPYTVEVSGQIWQR
jgi:hypothetical protein